MTIGTAQRITQSQAPGRSTAIALIPAAENVLGRLQVQTGLSQGDLANCAITWYGYFDAQLRAGYNLTLWNGETGKAYTLSLPARGPSAAHHVRWLPGNGGASGAGGGAQATPGFYFKAARLSQARPSPACPRLLPGPVNTSAQLWLMVVTSRGSPVAAPAAGAASKCAVLSSRYQPRQEAAASRNGGPS